MFNRIRPLYPIHRVSIHLEPGCPAPGRELSKIASKAIRAALSESPSRIPVCAELVFAGAARIRELNRSHRGKDAPTDVLSFPSVEVEKGRPPEIFAGPEDYDFGRLFLGSIIICPEIAETEAAQNGFSLPREYAFLAAHGALQLLGYDHETGPEDAQVMFDLQDDILKRICAPE